MLIPSNALKYGLANASLSRRVNANSQRELVRVFHQWQAYQEG